MIKLKYQNYEELPIKSYLELKEVLKNDNDDVNKEIEIISILSGIKVDELLEYNLSELQGITTQCEFLTKPIEPKEKFDKIIINDIEYVVTNDLSKFTVAQYVDFQNYPKNEQHLAENISTFVIPKGKKYGEDYDIIQTINDFKNYMSISDAISLQNFFVKKLVNSTKTTLHSLMSLMKMEMKKKKGKKAKETLKQIKELEQKYGFLL